MKLDPVKLQEVVDEMSVQRDDGTWELDHSYAPVFFGLIDEYLQKAANKSDHFDPENTFSDLRIGIWKALEAYGPRPKGNIFAEYTLKLKTNNILTNLHKKRESDKDLLNYPGKKKRKKDKSGSEISVISLDELTEIDLEGRGKPKVGYCDPIDLCALKESVREELLSRKQKRGRKRFTVSTILKHAECLSIDDKKILFYSLVGSILGKSVDEVVPFLGSFFSQADFYTELGNSLYYHNEETNMDKETLSSLSVGDKLLTKPKAGSVLEIRGKTEIKNKETGESCPGFKCLVFTTGKEIAIPIDYIENFTDLFVCVDEDPVEEKSDDVVTVVEEISEGVSEETVSAKKIFFDSKKEEVIEEEPVPLSLIPKENKLRVSASDILLKVKEKSVDNKKGDKVRLLVKLLKEGEQTRESLAQAIIDAGLSKTGVLAKEKNYVSVMLNTVKKSKKYTFAPEKWGVYQILGDA